MQYHWPKALQSVFPHLHPSLTATDGINILQSDCVPSIFPKAKVFSIFAISK